MADTLLSASHLRYAIAGRTLMNDVTLGIEAHSRIGLIGDNGAGKSTLLRLLAGALPPDGGTISRRNPCRIGVLQQVPDLPHGTVLEALQEPFKKTIAAIEELQSTEPGANYDGLLHTIESHGGWSWHNVMEQAAEKLGIFDFDRRCQDLSGGYRKRVALCRLLLGEPDVLFLDEPTNHLDTDTVLWLERFLAQSHLAAVVVTHDRYFLDQVATDMAELRGGTLRTYRGNYSDYLVARAEEEALESRTDARALRVLAHELDWASRSPQARTTKNRARLDRIEASRDAMASKTQGAKVDSLRFGDGPRLGKTILKLEGVTAAHAGHPPLFEPLTLEMSAQERWGIIGPNGSGKTSLLTLITGAKAPQAGSITRGKNTEIAYFDQHRTDLDPEALVETVLAPQGGDTVFFMGAPIHIRAWLQRFAFGPNAQRMQVKMLSGGERNRLALAKLMLTEANLLILDEPTNDLDLLTLNVLEDALLHYPGCAIVVSHDRYFLDKVATHTVTFVPHAQGSGRATLHWGTGGYTAQAERLQHLTAKITQDNKGAAAHAKGGGKTRATAGAVAPAASKTKRSYKQNRELEGMDAAIEAAEARVRDLEQALLAPTVWQDNQGADGIRLTAELQASQSTVRDLYERWQELLEMQ